MPYSMTGFTFVKKTFPDYEISVSVKSLNSKGFDLSLKGDKNVVMYLDLDIRKLFQESFERGTFQVVINITYQNLSNVLDVEKLKIILSQIKDLVNNLNLNLTDDKIYDILSYQLNSNNSEELPNQLKEDVLNTVKESILLLKQERKREGDKLILDIESRLKIIKDFTEKIEKEKEVILEKAKERIYQKVKQLLGENYSERAFIEATLLADKIDITEEVIRLKTHLERFYQLIKLDKPIGRKLDFLCQEMHREINTLGNKMPDFSNYTVEMKTQLEKIRQQVQNIE
ncbi:YicC/YloC family endoribonuclease [Sulfurihydrogenibium azorense]|uniref:YicC/YloC family endoribonuclease n=1 Tax=Sulfurihydrogenibium azorense TaxID=309806 RepID=UPI00240A402C|nr:YicC/YloC family endoribonuclease [Sulfurihydrogenibium azorense]MDM7273920.1 YicC/YloC family endoribonuclease [Sulfurihydrogenibium azorense]